MRRKKESSLKDKAETIHLYQKNKLMDISSIHRGYNSHVSALVSNTIQKIHDLEKHDPKTFGYFHDLLSEWKQTTG